MALAKREEGTLIQASRMALAMANLEKKELTLHSQPPEAAMKE
jgi:hypothetical protein